jgi:flagellar operon protein
VSQPDRINVNPAAVPPIQPNPTSKPGEAPRTNEGRTFGDILRTKVADSLPQTQTETTPDAAAVSSLRWSAHAQARLQQRGISLDDSQLARLDAAVDRLAAKGSRDSLVLLDQAAMVVSVKNRTVITALGRDQARDNVFTNIDSAVIA